MSESARARTETVLGVPFFTGTLEEAMTVSSGGGLVVVPSGPGLAWDLVTNPAYRAAVSAADLALTDSGFMVLIWNALRRFHSGSGPLRLERISGLKFLEALLRKREVREPGNSFWVMPSEEEMHRNLAWLRENGFGQIRADDCHAAPHYPRRAEGIIMDEALVRKLERHRPQWVLINVGSGVQEPLGHWLREQLSYRPALVCTGAAIAFLSGGQARIPTWADRLYLGWLMRVMHDPGKFLPRYVQALRLVPLLLRWREALPPLQTQTKLEDAG